MKVTLKSARVNAGYTQKEAAAAIGTNPATISLWEAQKRTPNIINAQKLCELYGVTINDVIFCREN